MLACDPLYTLDLRAPLRCARAFGRADGMLFPFYPALISQRASAPRKRDRATIGRPWRDWCILAFRRRCPCGAYAGCGLAKAALSPKASTPSTPGASPGVLFFSCSGNAIRRPKGHPRAGAARREFWTQTNRRLLGRTPSVGMAEETFSGPFDFALMINAQGEFLRRFAQGDSGKVSGRKTTCSRGVRLSRCTISRLKFRRKCPTL